MNKWKKIDEIKTINQLKDLANILTEAAKIYTEFEVEKIKHMAKSLEKLNLPG